MRRQCGSGSQRPTLTDAGDIGSRWSHMPLVFVTMTVPSFSSQRPVGVSCAEASFRKSDRLGHSVAGHGNSLWQTNPNGRDSLGRCRRGRSSPSVGRSWIGPSRRGPGYPGLPGEPFPVMARLDSHDTPVRERPISIVPRNPTDGLTPGCHNDRDQCTEYCLATIPDQESTDIAESRSLLPLLPVVDLPYRGTC